MVGREGGDEWKVGWKGRGWREKGMEGRKEVREEGRNGGGRKGRTDGGKRTLR
jgi:hypothetical protein